MISKVRENSKEFWIIYSIIMVLLIPINYYIGVESHINIYKNFFYEIFEIGLYLIVNAFMWLVILCYIKWYFQKSIVSKLDRFQLIKPKGQLVICIYLGIIYGFVEIERLLRIMNKIPVNTTLLLVSLLILAHALLTNLYCRIMIGESYLLYGNHFVDISSIISYKVVPSKALGYLGKIILITENTNIEILSTRKLLDEIQNVLENRIKV